MSFMSSSMAGAYSFQPGQPVRIGRNPDNAVVVADPAVSRQHAVLSVEQGNWVFKNVGRAATFRHGQPVTRAVVNQPMELVLASPQGPVLRVEADAAPAEQVQPPQGPPPPVTARRRRGPRIAVITLITILVLLVVGDRVANVYTENQFASQFQSSLDLSGKPHVTIHGFPFLTQLAARDLHLVTITASNETISASSAGSGLLEIASLTATLHGFHIHGFSSATIDQFNASALITFTALGNVGGIPQGITLSADGPNQVQATVSIFGFSGTATAQVTKTAPHQVNIHLIDAGGIPTSVLGNLVNFNVTIPKLPAGVSIQSVSVTQQGLRITVTGQNTTLSQ